jgi:transcriptional regulator GlxA family with amidase domain
MTIIEYICRERVSLAKKLIVTSQHSLSEISALCGFTDYNYFSRTFKRIAGVTAASYKKKKFKGD